MSWARIPRATSLDFWHAKVKGAAVRSLPLKIYCRRRRAAGVLIPLRDGYEGTYPEEEESLPVTTACPEGQRGQKHR